MVSGYRSASRSASRWKSSPPAWAAPVPGRSAITSSLAPEPRPACRPGSRPGQQRLHRRGRRAAGGQRGRSRIQVERRHGGTAHRGQDMAGHQGGDGLSRAPGAAEDGNPARTGQRQPGAVAIQRLRVPLAWSLAAGDHLYLAPPAHLAATARAAERPLDGRQPPLPLHADEPGRHRRGRSRDRPGAGSAGAQAQRAAAGAGADVSDAGMRSAGAGSAGMLGCRWRWLGRRRCGGCGHSGAMTLARVSLTLARVRASGRSARARTLGCARTRPVSGCRASHGGSARARTTRPSGAASFGGECIAGARAQRPGAASSEAWTALARVSGVCGTDSALVAGMRGAGDRCRRGRWRRLGRRGPVQCRSGGRTGLNAEHPARPRLGRRHGHLRPGGRCLGASSAGRRSLRWRSRGGGASGTAGLAA